MSELNSYINREISWLDFNERILQEASDDSVPLVERMRFLGIYSNNLDEFYQVRYATVIRAIQYESSGYNNILENQSNQELVEQIDSLVVEHQKKYNQLYQKILKLLQKEYIYIVDDKTIPEKYKDYIHQFYEEKLRRTLSIYILKKKQKAPQLTNGALYLAIRLIKETGNLIGLIEVPSNDLDRFVVLPKDGKRNYAIFLDDIIRLHLDHIFRNFDFNSIESHSIKITRDAELDMDNDVNSSFLETIAKSVEHRKRGEPVRMVYDKKIDKETLRLLHKILKFNDNDNLIAGEKYHNKKDLMKFPDFGRKDMIYKKLLPIISKRFEGVDCYFSAIAKKDHLIYAPYQDYRFLIKFLHEASFDPLVEKIQITIYRAAKNSQILKSLINAARNGKEVTAVLELRARFDESNNVNWSKKLQNEGINVVFGVPGLKVHSKVALITRKKDKKIPKHFAIISTGNFNEDTANIYTDFTLITAHIGITQEVKQLFQFFDANYLIQSYKHLIVSPLQSRKKFIKLIKKEIKNHKKGLPAQINIKLNSLSDKAMIDALYEASQIGVEVRLVVRGIHSLKISPNPKAKHIKSISIIDRFLEHPRIYWFKNAGEDKIFISSADLMVRNLDHRIEVSAPIYDKNLKQVVINTFNLNFYDNVKARLHNQNNRYANREIKLYDSIKDLTGNNQTNRSQETIYEYLKQLNENPETSSH